MTEKYSKDQKATLYVALITAFVTTFTGSALNLSIPDMGSEFHVSASFIGWVVIGYMLAVAALSVPFGRFADLTNKKRVLITGILVFGAASLFSVFAWNIWALIGFRVVQGIGGAMIFSTNTATLIGVFPGNQRGKVLGYSIAATYIGLSAGPVVGGILNYYTGWRSIFMFTFLLTAVVSTIAIRRLPPAASQASGEFDLLGNVLYILMIISLMLGLSTLSTGRNPLVLVGMGACLTVAFVLHEKRVKDPIINIGLFVTNASYTASNLAALLNYGATFATGYLMSIYLQVVMHYSSGAAGLILIVQPVMMAMVSPSMGKLSDKVSPYKLASLGMSLCTVGLFLFMFITEEYPLWLIIVALLISGLGFGVFSSPNTNAVMSCVEKQDYGVVTSVLATMRSLGHTSSMAIVTIIVGIHMGTTGLSEASPKMLLGTMHTAFAVFAVICFLGVFIRPLVFGVKRLAEVVFR